MGRKVYFNLDVHKVYPLVNLLLIGLSGIGKSTAIIAMGLTDAGHDFPFYSVDLAPQLVAGADSALKAHDVRDRVILIQGDSSAVVRQLPGKFDVVFVDGDHSYDGVTADTGCW